MRAKEFAAEGLWGDLRAVGQANQAAAMDAAKNRMAAFRGKITPQFFKDIAARASAERGQQDLEQLANSFASSWAATAKKINDSRGPGQAMELPEYQKTFAAWLAKETKTRPDVAQIQAMVTATEPKLVKDYMLAHFIPKYQTAMANPLYTIPDGHREIGTFIASNGQRSDVEYEWDSTEAAFVDPVTGDKAGARQMQAMISSAMAKLSAAGKQQGDLSV